MSSVENEPPPVVVLTIRPDGKGRHPGRAMGVDGVCGVAPEGECVGGGGVLALGAGGAALERDGEQGEGTEAGFALAALVAALAAALEGGEGLARAAASGRCDQARDSQSVEPAGGSAKSEGLHWPSSPRSRAPPSAPRFAADFAADFAAGEATREGEAALRLAGEREAGRAWAACSPAGEGDVGLRVEAGSPPPARAGVPTGLVYLGLGLGLGLG